MVIGKLRNSPSCLVYNLFRQADGNNHSVLCICIYIHVFLFVHTKCISIKQSYFLLVKQILALHVRTKQTNRGLASNQVWEALPQINLNFLCPSFSPPQGTAESYGLQSVSPTTVLSPTSPILRLSNGNSLLTHTGTAPAWGICCVWHRGQSLDACLIGRGAVPHNDLGGGRPDCESCSVDFLEVCSTLGQSLWRTPTHQIASLSGLEILVFFVRFVDRVSSILLNKAFHIN